MFKLPNGLPSLSRDSQEWADFMEYHAFLKKSINLYELTKPIRLISDEDKVMGVEDDTDRFLQKVDEISAEIRTRSLAGGALYPFEIADQGYTLKYMPQTEISSIIYPYLLLATRTQMGIHRVKEKIDGALLFEELCALVAQKYFGDRATVDILGTSKSDNLSFRDKLRTLIKQLGEGGEVHENKGHKPQDGNVDVIVWKGFRDQQPSKMIGFGQCKTGTTWADKISELNTEAFCKLWFTKQPVLTPIRMFFTAQYFPREIFHVRAYEAGLVFDRFRILDYLPGDLDEDILYKMLTWSQAITRFYQNA